MIILYFNTSLQKKVNLPGHDDKTIKFVPSLRKVTALTKDSQRYLNIIIIIIIPIIIVIIINIFVMSNQIMVLPRASLHSKQNA